MAESNKGVSNIEEIGTRIKLLREKKNFTQADVAKKLNVRRETVAQWETGTRDLKTDYTVKLADIFDTTCDYLLRGIQSQNVDINKQTGLSDASIANLAELKIDISKDIEQAPRAINFIDHLMSTTEFKYLMLDANKLRKLYLNSINYENSFSSEKAYLELFQKLDFESRGQLVAISPTEYYGYKISQLKNDFIKIVEEIVKNTLSDSDFKNVQELMSLREVLEKEKVKQYITTGGDFNGDDSEAR